MDALAAWLKQIILVVLLATFIDLLLPNRTMQRYVKLVVSLFILMTILSPIMNLLGSSANLRMLAAAVDGWDMSGMSEAPPGTGGANRGPGSQASQSNSIPALSEVLSSGEELGAKRDAESLKLLELKMEAMVKEQIESQYEVAVLKADASLAMDRDRFPVVKRISVVIGSRQDLQSEPGEETSEPWGMEPVKPMDPVQVRIEVNQLDEPQNSLPATAGNGKLTKEEQKKKQEIVEALSRQWNVDARRIEIIHDRQHAAARE